MNGGTPPLTYSMFGFVTAAIGQPERPLPDPEFPPGKMIVLDSECQIDSLCAGKGQN